MAFKDWLLGRPAAPQVQASAFSGTDGNGYEVADFSSSAVDLVRSLLSSDSHGELYRTQWAVRTCVDFLAENIAHLNLKTYRKDDGTPDYLRDHPLNVLLHRPNDSVTRDQFSLIRATVSDLAIYDNAYWLKKQVGQNRALYLLPPSYVTVEEGNILTGPKRYWLSSGSTRTPVSPNDIVHFHGYNPIDPRIGSSPLTSLRYILMEEIEASRYRSKYFAKGARVPGVIERPSTAPPWGDIERTRFRESWRKFRRGGVMEGEEPVLEDDMKYHEGGFSPKDSEFIEGREFALDTVATQYRIPLALLSRKGTATFASMKEFHNILYVDVLGPWNAMIENTINTQLVPDFGESGLYVEFNIDEKLQGDFEQQANAARQSVQVPWHSVNEMREKRGLPKIDDSRYDVPPRPSNYEYGEGAPEQQTLGLEEELAMLEETR